MLLRQSRQSGLCYAIPNESVIFNGLVCWGTGAQRLRRVTEGDMENYSRFSLCAQEGDLRADTYDLSVASTARDLTTVNILTRA